MTQSFYYANGNGRMLVYGNGPNIPYVFGPPYTSCNQLSLTCREGLQWTTRRIPGTMTWQHTGRRDENVMMTLTDVLHPQLPLWARQIDIIGEALEMNIQWPQAAELVQERCEKGEKQCGFRVKVPEGTPLFDFFPHYYLSLTPAFHLIQASGNLQCQSGEKLKLLATPGRSELRIAGGPDFPANREAEELSWSLSFEEIRQASEAWAGRFFSRITCRMPDRMSFELASEVRRAAEDVAVLIKAQQGLEGGVIAGYPFQLAYVRDQYGVSRAMLELGLYMEAERILDFRMKKWKLYGNIRNAETVGWEGVRHHHEHDESEITAYNILQAFDYAEATGMQDRLFDWFPMLDWCFEAQLPALAGNMLPFNGDETYIAGSFIGRECIDHGSAEATLLFLESGFKLLAFARSSRLWSEERCMRNHSILQQVEKAYLPNFYRGGRFITNNPERLQQVKKQPRYRHGVCMGCSGESSTWIGWTEHQGNGVYLCPRCQGKVRVVPAPPVIHAIPSSALFPAFIRSGRVPPGLLESQAEEMLVRFRRVMEGEPGSEEERFVGYDMGYMLCYMADTGHPELACFLRFVLDSRDGASNWSERFIGRGHDGCSARPWESSINLTAILRAAGKLYSK